MNIQLIGQTRQFSILLENEVRQIKIYILLCIFIIYYFILYACMRLTKTQ